MIPEINIGMVGHIDHGKTSLLKSLTGKWASTHSEELKRGITIRLGYSSMTINKCPENHLTIHQKCRIHNKPTKSIRKISFVDAPGHETLMATMLSGASVMDAAILVIAANESCPQPQTREHLAALNVLGIKRVIIVQNKVDLVSDEEALNSYNTIKEFIKGSVAEDAPIIPMSALHDANLDVLLEAIEEFFPTPKRDLSKPPVMLVSRSFDVNKPGASPEELSGGVLGGILKQGSLKKGSEVIILPGLRGNGEWTPVTTSIEAIFYDSESLSEAVPGGNFAISTLLDPGLTRGDSLSGSVVCTEKHQPPVFTDEFKFKPELMERVVGTSSELELSPLKMNESLMINAHTSKTVGVVSSIRGDVVVVRLKLPVVIDYGEKIAISRFINNKWRLVGSATVVE